MRVSRVLLEHVWQTSDNSFNLGLDQCIQHLDIDGGIDFGNLYAYTHTGVSIYNRQIMPNNNKQTYFLKICTSV